ncbi:unnamed protein product [Cuscuta campestris]|uniref:Uncharacterized protein n=1 Tax=Cuscuta campestris TaxID=132261 RepID=A0A484LTV5_9ASTE|nr:unnamed protein product [Cuscuta campestris]
MNTLHIYTTSTRSRQTRKVEQDSRYGDKNDIFFHLCTLMPSKNEELRVVKPGSDTDNTSTAAKVESIEMLQNGAYTFITT